MSLREHYITFLNFLDVDAVLPYMLSDGILTRAEYDKIRNPSLPKQCDELLRALPNKGRNFYQKFCICIAKSGQMELIKEINFNVPEGAGKFL